MIVGFQKDSGFGWSRLHLPDLQTEAPKLKTILHSEDGTENPDGVYTVGPIAAVHEKYVLTTKLWNYLKAYAEKHRAKGNGFGYGLFGPEEVARTLSARYYKDGSEILIRRGKNRNPRRLTPRECARIMGFPESFKIVVSDTRAYKQFGNSVIVPLASAVAGLMKEHILAIKQREAVAQRQPELVF
jgi:DNA (cytosine-5)-methyltransferase 1